MKITLENICLNFGKDQVLQDLSLDFNSSELSCLLGRSGSGKTSILKIIAGILQPQKGKVYFDDSDVTDIRTQERKVGWVPQQQLIFPGLNVRENIAYGLKARNVPREKREKQIKATIQLVGLEELINRDPAGLSGGERQRVALARAIAPQPDVLLLDEPFSSLDAPERDRLSLAFRQIQLEAGVTTIYVTHAPREAELLSDKVFILSEGNILQEGKIHQIQDNPSSPEVAKLLNIPNFVSMNQVLGIHQPTIIPSHAVQINSNNSEIPATVLSRTLNKIYLRIEHTILELDIDRTQELTAGQIITINIDRDHLITLRSSQ